MSALVKQSATLTNVASSATSVTLFNASGTVRNRIIVNESTAILYVKFGTTASLTSYTVSLAAGARYEFSSPLYGGRVDGIWSAADGNARCTAW